MKSQKSKILNSAEELRAAVKSARERERSATKIKAAHYETRGDVIVAELSTGAVLTVPRRAIPGFAKVQPRKLSDLEITPGGEGLWSDSVDDGVLLEQLLVLAAGESMLARIGARINASKRSPARAAASRKNGAKGGRPRKSAA